MSSIIIDITREDSSSVDAELLLGVKGDTGKSAYQYAVEGGYQGTETEFLAEMARLTSSADSAENSAQRAEAALSEFTEVTATATTLEAGADATAVYVDGELTFGIPQGEKGEQGDPYDDSVIVARMDTFTNLAEGSTTGDAELADGRVGADGVTYTNIGGAIRGQVTDLKSDLNDVSDSLFNTERPYASAVDGKYPFSKGYYIGAVGDNLSSTTPANAYMLSPYTYYISKPTRFKVPNGFECCIRVCERQSPNRILFVSAYSNTIYVDPTDYSGEVAFAVNVRKVGGANLTDDERATIHEGFSVFYTTIGTYFTENIKMMLEHGQLSGSHYLYDDETYKNNFYNHMRTPHLLDLSDCRSITVKSNWDSITMVKYNANAVYVSESTITANSQVTIDGSYKFVRFVVANSGLTNINYAYGYLEIECEGNPRITKAISDIANSGNIVMNYIVDGALGRDNEGTAVVGSQLADTCGIIRLPPNYSNIGEPVPLIVYAHGSSDYENKWQIRIRNQVGNREVIDYLVNEGFAVFDCYGHSSNAPIIGIGHTYGNIDCMNCYLSGIKRCMEVYNIKTDGVYVTGISSGGLTALNMAYINDIPVRACAPFAPAISLYRYTLGYTEEQRKEYAWAMGFEGDSSVLAGRNGAGARDWSYPAHTEALFEYLRNNADKTIGYNPMWNGLIGVSRDQLVTWAIAPYNSQELGGGDRDSANWVDKYRYSKVPMKIWIADDDTNVPPEIIYNYIKTLKNGQSVAELRMIPDGEGGHYAFSSSETAVRISGTTALGISYTDIPYPWVELVAFFRRY